MAVVLTLVLAGCACTEVACNDVILFDRTQLEDWIGSDTFSIEVCTDGECTTASLSRDPTRSPLGFPISEEAAGATEVDLTVTAGSASRTASGSIEFAIWRPNGSFCPPAGRVAEISIDDGVLRNAATDSFLDE